MTKNTTRPLSHIRVLGFGQYLAGPLVGMMLADLGAILERLGYADRYIYAMIDNRVAAESWAEKYLPE